MTGNNGFVPSAYQQAIFDFVVNGRGNGIVNAVAGSGKTTTLVKAAYLLSASQSLFVAFNKHIADELKQRLAGTGMTARTVHSIGFGCLAQMLNGRLQVDESKYYKIVRDMAALTVSKDDRGMFIRKLNRLARYVRVTLTDPTDVKALERLCVKYDIDADDRVLKTLPAVLERGAEIAEYEQRIDYTDMLYLPVIWELQPRKYDWVFVDEAQDLSAAQLELVLRCRAPGGRMLFVGDRRQAIYGFSGADYASFARIKTVTDAIELPLSICYRCPTSHLELARRIVPEIEARPGAPEGTIRHVDINDFPSMIREGDLVLCRTNAPLVRWCIELIKRQIPARMRGRDIGRDLTSILKAIEKAQDAFFDFGQMPRYLDEYERQQVHNLAQREGTEAQIESLRDRVECLQVCYASMNAKDMDDLCGQIEALFSDGRASVWFSSVHRAKGLENRRVFILRPDQMPLVWDNQTPDQEAQEWNLKYVALTRAKEELIFVNGDTAT